MIVLDTDILTLFFQNHQRVSQRMQQTTEEVAITVVTLIETLQGRFSTLIKAADGAELQRAQQRLDEAHRDLARIPKVLAISADSGAEFDRLRQNKKLRKIGRRDILIAAITLANRATLVSRNLKDFHLVAGLRVENWAD